jgi:hypothetical protein
MIQQAACFGKQSRIHSHISHSCRGTHTITGARLLLRELALHQVQRRAGLEPFDLLSVERVIQLDVERCGARRWDDTRRQRLARRERREASNVDAVSALDAVVVSRVTERQRKDTLLLEIRLVDAGE